MLQTEQSHFFAWTSHVQMSRPHPAHRSFYPVKRTTRCTSSSCQMKRTASPGRRSKASATIVSALIRAVTQGKSRGSTIVTVRSPSLPLSISSALVTQGIRSTAVQIRLVHPKTLYQSITPPSKPATRPPPPPRSPHSASPLASTDSADSTRAETTRSWSAPRRATRSVRRRA